MSFIEKIRNLIWSDHDVYIDSNKQLIKKHLPKNPIILEAGACDGRDTLQMASLWPQSQIHSFEPIPELYKAAQSKLTGKKNVNFYPFALSERTGSVQFHVSSGTSNGSSSILSPLKHLEVHPEVKFNSTVEVMAYNIDDWATLNGIMSIDFMWLDMQGAEYNVLRASPRILSTTKVIFTEVSLIETYKDVILYPQYKQWLEGHGFSVVFEDLPYRDMGNVLFVRNK